jgi:S-DNA-T family DNA segregation ATPase FtsK/SpoIIIE
VTLLTQGDPPSNVDIADELKTNAARLVDTLRSFGVETRITDISRGPSVTRYELQPSAGVKISRITSLSDDISLNLASAGVRIEAPIPNKAAVGIEVPNKIISIVHIREIIESPEFRDAPSRLTIALGRDVAGNAAVADIATMPHVLIAGATGSGKSVCINSIIISLLYRASPEEVRLLMVDPKIVELGCYNGIPHLLVPVVTEPRRAAGALGWAVGEMQNRYKLFAESGVRDIRGYNALAKKEEGMQPIPQVVIIIDELADLIMAAPGDVEDAICRLAQKARAAGMHLVIATQRPSVDVITGLIKANIPSRIAFAVSSQVDSRTILDAGGAEKLLGRGDMLFWPIEAAKPTRMQGCFVSDAEVEAVIDFVKSSAIADYDENVMDEIDKQAVTEKGTRNQSEDDDDALLPNAIECVVEAGIASTSLLQRRLKLGYARAARIVDEMESRGIVGPLEGSKPRQVLITRQQWLEMYVNKDH